MSTRNVLIWGAGGYVGAELLRLVSIHPNLQLAGALSSTYANFPVAEIYPGLADWTDEVFHAPDQWDWSALENGSWLVFAALGHGDSMHQLPEKLAIEGDIHWIDMSGDFRLNEAERYEEYYGHPHVAPEWMERFAYGLPELNREVICSATRVANPGCFATGAQLALLPAAAHSTPIEFVAVDGKTGSSGSGARAKSTTHHPERSNNFRAYKLLTHQHLPEIENGWIGAGGKLGVEISFAPQSAPMVRGIYTTAHFFLAEPVSHEEVVHWYDWYYADAPFVRRVEGAPEITAVWGTNRCDLSVHVEGRRVVVCTAIDNLVKGAAGQAIHNANLMNGWEETTGLNHPAPWPV